MRIESVKTLCNDAPTCSGVQTRGREEDRREARVGGRRARAHREGMAAEEAG